MATSNTSYSRNSTSSRRSYTPLWDAEATLQIAPNYCVGHAHTQGRKCRTRLAAHNVCKGDTILQDLSNRRPDPEALRPRLRRLAEVLLCPRWHRDQAENMVNQWVDRIEDTHRSVYLAESPRAVAPSTSASRSRTGRQNTSASRSETSTSTPASRPIASERETVQELIAVMTEMLQTAQRRLGELDADESPTSTLVTLTPPISRASSSTPSVSRTSTSDISSLTLSRSSTVDSTPLTSTPENNNASPTPSPRCGRRHVRRRAIDDECPICAEDFLLRDQLVWCQDGCGRTVHHACFEAWESECRAGRRTTTCVVCRADWIGCECVE